MDSKKFKCVFSDLDKTLLASGSVLTEYTKETIELLTSRGIDFVPSSGRAFNSLPEDLFFIKGIKYAVTSNGVCVNDIKTGEPLSSMFIPEEDLKNIISFIEGKKVWTEIFIKGQGYTSRDYWNDPSIAEEKGSERKAYVQATRIPLDDYAAFIQKNTACTDAFDIIGEPEIIFKIRQELEKKISGVYFTNSEDFLIEISNLESGKHRGMERCCKILNIKPEECIAFGDASNDREMLSSAGLGIAVANATEDCKAAADYVSSLNCNEDAVAKELRKIFNL